MADEKVTPEERAVTVASYIVSTAPHIDGPKADAQHIADKIAAEIRAAEQAARDERDAEWRKLWAGGTGMADPITRARDAEREACEAICAERAEQAGERARLAPNEVVKYSQEERRSAYRRAQAEIRARRGAGPDPSEERNDG